MRFIRWNALFTLHYITFGFMSSMIGPAGGGKSLQVQGLSKAWLFSVLDHGLWCRVLRRSVHSMHSSTCSGNPVAAG